MYSLELYESGVFVTEVGSPLKTLPEAIEQIGRMTSRQGVEPTDMILGARWDKPDGARMFIIVVDDWGQAIRDAEVVEEQECS